MLRRVAVDCKTAFLLQAALIAARPPVSPIPQVDSVYGNCHAATDGPAANSIGWENYLQITLALKRTQPDTQATGGPREFPAQRQTTHTLVFVLIHFNVTNYTIYRLLFWPSSAHTSLLPGLARRFDFSAASVAAIQSLRGAY